MCIQMIIAIAFLLNSGCSHNRSTSVTSKIEQQDMISIIGLTGKVTNYNIQSTETLGTGKLISIQYEKDHGGYLILLYSAFKRKVANPGEWTIVESRKDISSAASLRIIETLSSAGAVTVDLVEEKRNNHDARQHLPSLEIKRVKFNAAESALECIRDFESGKMPVGITLVGGEYFIKCELKDANSTKIYGLKVKLIGNQAEIKGVTRVSIEKLDRI